MRLPNPAIRADLQPAVVRLLRGLKDGHCGARYNIDFGEARPGAGSHIDCAIHIGAVAREARPCGRFFCNRGCVCASVPGVAIQRINRVWQLTFRARRTIFSQNLQGAEGFLEIHRQPILGFDIHHRLDKPTDALRRQPLGQVFIALLVAIYAWAGQREVVQVPGELSLSRRARRAEPAIMRLGGGDYVLDVCLRPVGEDFARVGTNDVAV